MKKIREIEGEPLEPQGPKTEEQERKAREEANRKEIERQKREKALMDYDDRLDRVIKTKEMTDTSAWQAFYAVGQKIIAQASKDILNAEKPREVVQCQERVKVAREFFATVKQTVDDLNTFCHEMPLFARDFKTRASWNEGLGRIEISET